MPQILCRLLLLCLALGLLSAPGPATSAYARAPQSPRPAPGTERRPVVPTLRERELVNVALELHGEPAVKAFIDMRERGIAKADAAQAQKARLSALEAAQASVVAAVRTKAPGARILGQHRRLVNVVTVRVRRAEIEALAGLPGVRRVSEIPDFKISLAQSVPYVGADRVRQELGITGRGVRVGVIDTGIDYTHRDFGGPGTVAAYDLALTDPTAVTETLTITATTGLTLTTRMYPTAKIAGGWDFIGDRWPHTPDGVLEPDQDPLDTRGDGSFAHGTHVASIIAGFGVPNESFNGSIPPDTSFNGTTVYHGVAPAATLFAYRVCSTSAFVCSGVSMVGALEAAMDPDYDGDMSDHLDVVNMSLAADFGYDPVTAQAANNAVLGGVAVVTVASNAGDVPYSAGAPGIADRVLSVASIQVGDGGLAILEVTAPATLAGRRARTQPQDWAPPLPGEVEGEVVFVGRGCPAGSVPDRPEEDSYLADPRGKIALIERGACNVSLKAARASAAGAVAVLVQNNVPGAPPIHGYGGGEVTAPTLTISQEDGAALRGGSGVRVRLTTLSARGFISDFSARGPSIVDNLLKPDLSAPGTGITAAGAATGDEALTLSGTSMASPHVAGILALLRAAHPTWTAQELEAVAPNTARPTVQDMGSDLVPYVVSVSRQGAGVVDGWRALNTATVAYSPNQVGSISFGFKAVVDTLTDTRPLVVRNKGTTTRTYDLGFDFQFPERAPAGSSVTVVPSSITLGPDEAATVEVRLSLVGAGLPPYGLAGFDAADPRALSRSEVTGFVRVVERGGAADRLSVPVHALARRASAVDVGASAMSLRGFGVEDGSTLQLTNRSAFSGTAEIFALLGVDPDEPEHPDGYDIEYVGVRRGAGDGAAGPTIEFGVKTFGPRTVALDSTFEIGIDYNRDGVYDYVAFNADRLWRSGEGTVGQNYTYIIDLATHSLSGPYYPTTFTANSSSAVLRLNAGDLGITSETQPFDFYVLTYRNADLQRWDVAPDSGVYTHTVRDARFRTDRADGRVTLAAGTTVTVGLYANARGFLDGESAERFPQQGILLLYTHNAPTADEADIVTVSFPFRYRVELQTLRFNPNLSGYLAGRGIGPGGPGVNFGVGDLWTGVDNRAINPLIYHGIVHFELGATGGVVEIEDAVLELTGLDTRYMDRRYYGRWGVDMLTAVIDANLDKLNFFGIARAPADARLAPVVDDGALAAGRTVPFVLDGAARAKLEAHTRTSGRVTFRTFEEPLYEQGLQLFAWDGRTEGEGAKPPVLHILNVTHLP